MIEATRTAPGVVEAAGLTVKHRTPTLALCRALLAAGHDDGPLVVHDVAGRVVMTIRSIAEAAEMTVMENANAGPRFAKFVPFTGIDGGEA
jgi:hypothetical protein